MSKIHHVALGALGLLSAQIAHAQVGTSPAEREFEAGQAAEEAGNMAQACQHYRAALALERKPGALRWTARCDAQEGRILDALAKMDEALLQIPSTQSLHAEYAAERAAMKASLSRLTLELKPGSAPLVVTLDGKPAPAWGEARELDPGRHTLVVEGSSAPEQIVELAKGEAKTVVLPLTSTDVGPPPPPIEDGGPWLVLAGVSFGVAGAAAIATIATGALILDRDSEANEVCSLPGQVGCDEAIDDTKALLAPNLVFWILMGASAGAGLTFAIVDATSGDTTSDTPRPKTTVRLGPGGVALSRSF